MGTETEAEPRDLTPAELDAIERANRNGQHPKAVLAEATLAEDAVLGACLINGDAIEAAQAAGLEPAHFRRPHMQLVADAIWTLAASGEDIDAVTVALTLDEHDQLDRIGGPARLTDLTAAPATVGSAGAYARAVIAAWRSRQVTHIAADLHQAAADPDAAIEAARARLDDLAATTTTTTTVVGGITLGDLLAEVEEPHDWVIPDLLERGDRCLLTGPEGGGKSTLLRQIATQAAAGIHPFTLEPTEAATVLLIDVENSRRHIKRQIRPLAIAADHRADQRLWIISHPQGLDLCDEADRSALWRAATEVQPDLIIGGPVYKLFDGDPIEEAPAKAVATFLGRLIAEVGAALMLETHQPHETKGGSRPERPYGASLWKRWPEFGLHLSEQGDLRHWRGDRDQRSWPAALTRGGPWPWMAETDQRNILYARISDACREAGRVLSLREMQTLLSVPKSTIDRALKANEMAWDGLRASLGEHDAP